MDNVIGGEKTAALIEGVSDIMEGFRHDAASGRDSVMQVNGDMLSENGMIILCRCGSAIVNVNYHAWSLPYGGVITIFPGDVVSVAGSPLILVSICWCSVRTSFGRPVWISNIVFMKSCARIDAVLILKWFLIL